MYSFNDINVTHSNRKAMGITGKRAKYTQK